MTNYVNVFVTLLLIYLIISHKIPTQKSSRGKFSFTFSIASNATKTIRNVILPDYNNKYMT